MAIPSGSLKVKYDFSDPDCYSGSGNTIYDLTLNGNDSNLINSPTFSGSGSSKYFYFDKTDWSNRTGEIAGIGTNPVLTFNAWVRIPANGTSEYECIFGYGVDAGGGGGVPSFWKRYGNVNKFLATFGSDVGNVDAGSYNLNEWYNVVYTTTGTASTVYINGIKDNENLSLSGIISNSSGGPYLNLGCMSLSSYPGSCDIAYFELYNASLAPADVSTLYSDNSNRFIEPNLIVKYDLADPACYPGSGNTVANLGPDGNLFGTITGAGFSSPTDSLTFDSTGDRIVVDESFYNIGADNNFTYIVVFNRNTPISAGSQTLFSIPYRGNWSELPYYGIYLGYDNVNNRYEFNTNTSSNYVLSGFAVTNTIADWTVAAVTYSSGTANFYENGIGVSTVTGLPASIDLINSTQLAIGQYASFFTPADGQFTGQLAAFELHSEVLSAGAISSISEDYLDRFGPAPPPTYEGIVGGRMFGEGFNG
jgi:hypothetical protein